MKKIIMSIIIIGLLLSTAPINTGGKESIKKTASNVSEPTVQTPIDDFNFKKSEMLKDAPKGSDFLEPISYPLGNDSIPLPDYVPEELIVEFQENVKINLQSVKGTILTNIESLDTINSEYGSLKSVEQIFKNSLVSSLSNVYKFSFSNSVDIPSLAKDYMRAPYVVYAEPNYVYNTYVVSPVFKGSNPTCTIIHGSEAPAHIFSSGTIPNDPYFSQQWALAKIDASDAWDIEKGESDVVIAIIDTGVDYNHPDLAANIWHDPIYGNPGYDFVNNDDDPMDDYGHGTHCAGIASAVTNNGVGIAGVCWNCKVMPVKAFDSNGNGQEANITNAIIYAVDNGADIISMSWGGSSSNLIKDALDYAYQEGVVLVAAAGNIRHTVSIEENTNFMTYPAAYNNVIAVAATNGNDQRANAPGAWESNYGYWVDVAAPGDQIISTIPGNIYELHSGTSMACPHVSGLAGLLLSKNHSLIPAMIRTMICNGADKINTDECIGGRINASKTIQLEPAIAILDYVLDWENEVKGIIPINGSVWGENFQYFELEYGRGLNPVSWIKIKNSTTPHPQDGVLANLNTMVIDEGFYAIRLRVICDTGEYSSKIWILINNTYNTFYVDDDNVGGPWNGTSDYPYQHIKDGILDAAIGDDVYVYNGTYHESNIRIKKRINLIGEDRNGTIIDGRAGYRVIRIRDTNGVTINGFTIEYGGGCGASNYFPDYHVGLNIFYSDYNTISNNVIIANNQAGVFIYGSSNNKIEGNIIRDNDIRQIIVAGGENNTITGNIVKGDTGTTYYDCISFMSSSYNIIEGNFIEGGYESIYLDYGQHNIIVGNNITHAYDIGVFLNWGDINNTVYYNNFIDNTLNAAVNACDNTFYNDKIRVGNYWDNYAGKDKNGDGIGDTPYKIGGTNTEVDLYPLMEPHHAGNYPPSIPNIDGPRIGKVGVEYTYNFSTTDIDGDNVCYCINWGDGSTLEWTGYYATSEIATAKHTWSTLWIYTIKVKAKDTDGAESDWGRLAVIMPTKQSGSQSSGQSQSQVNPSPQNQPGIQLLIQMMTKTKTTNR